MGLATRLYRGETEFPIIQRRKVFYTIAAVLVLISVLAIVFRGFNLGVEFKGGATFQWPTKGVATVEDARELFESKGIPDPIVQTVGGDDGDLRVQVPPLTEERIDEVIAAIDERFPEVTANEINPSNVGPAWGQQVTNKALTGLVVFLIVVMLYISVQFEPKMAAASIVGLFHDLALAMGIYAILQFPVTPSTVIAFLTVLGFSLYDSVVIFDRVQENTKGIAGGSTSTYTEAAELALNQSFMRSVNTTLTALLPVSGLLFVGAGLLGAGTLKDLSLALFVGLAAGAYSSIFLVTPLFVDLKEREPQYKALTARVLARRSGTGPRAGTSRFAQRAAARASGEPRPAVAPAEASGEAAGDAADGAGEPVAPTATAAPPRSSGSVRQPSGARKGAKSAKKGKGGRPSGKRR